MTKILLVEDNPHNRAVFLAALGRLGHEILVAEDGERALELAEQSPPDLILLDLSLPKVDGWSVARALRSSSKVKISSVPIVALTAHAMKGDRERAIEAGCDDYLTKPISPRQLIRKVKATLERNSNAA